MPVRVSPLGLAGNYSGDQTVTLTGVGSPVQGGNVVATGNAALNALGRLSPLGLHQTGYNINAKVGNASVTLSGAEVRCQGEELEGASVTIRLLGATVFFNGQDLDQEFVDNGTRIANDDASTDEPTHVNMCEITGVRFYNDERMFKTWEGRIVKKHSFDEKHPQLDHVVKPTYEQRKYKRRNPEEEDIFLSTNEVTVDDL